MPPNEKARASLGARARAALVGAAGYGAIATGLGGLRFLVLPWVTRVVSVDEFSEYALIVVAVPVLVALCDLGTGDALVRFSSGETDEMARARLAASLFWSRLAACGAVVALSSMLAWPLTRGLGARLEIAIELAIVVAGAEALAAALTDILRAEHQHRGAAALLAIQGAGSLVAMVIGVERGYGLHALVGAHFVGSALAIVFGLALRGRALARRPSGADVARFLGFGLPIAATAVFGIGLGSDRYVASSAGGARGAGVYHLAAAPAFFVDLAARAVRFAFEPTLYATRQAELTTRFDPMLRIYALALVVGAGFFSALAPELAALLGPVEYRPAAALIPWLVFAEATHTLFRFTSLTAGVIHRTRIVTACAAVELAIALGGGLALAPLLGPVGVAGARLAGGVVAFVTCVLLVRRHWRVEASFTRIALLACAGPVLLWACLEAPYAPGVGLGIRLGAWAALSALAVAALLRRGDLTAVARRVDG